MQYRKTKIRILGVLLLCISVLMNTLGMVSVSATEVGASQSLLPPEGQSFTAVEMTGFLESHIQTDAEEELFGIQSTTITIGSADDLVAFANNINNNTYPADINAVLTSDIDMEGKTWTPIGYFNHPYQGTFDGNNHVVMNVTCATSGTDVGIFGSTKGASIKNLGVTGSFSGTEYIGGIVGYALSSTIENCWNGASVTGSGGNIGGIAGSLGEESGGALIKNSYNYGMVYGTYAAGGIAGTLGNVGTISNCFSYAETEYKIAGRIFGGSPGVINSYYLSTSQGTSSLGTAVTEAQFKWGEVAWLLNEQNPNGIWKQTFGTDDYPKFTGNDVTQPISKPSVSVSAPAAVNIGQTLPLGVPTVDDNGNTVTNQGWEISSDGSTNWIAFVPATTMTYVHNGQYLRYYATNIVSTGYSNSVQITVNKLNLSLSLSCLDITFGGSLNPQLTGNTDGGAVTYEYKAQGSLDSGYSATVPGDAGAYTVRASVAATDMYNGDTAAADFSILKADPVIHLTASPADGSVADDTVTLTATLTGVNTSDYPTGSIVFKDGNTVLETAALVNGEASHSWQNVPYGTHNLTAEYDGDNNYEHTSDTISGYSVPKKTQNTLNITGTPESIVYGDGSFTLSTTGGNGSGDVTYTVQNGDAVSVNGNIVMILKAGTVVIQANKAADSIYNETNITISLTVKQAAPTIPADSVVNGANAGKALSTVSLSELTAFGVDGKALAGSFAWENPQAVVESAGKHTVIFTPTESNYKPASFEVQVGLDATKPVIEWVQATPSINGAKLEVKATAGTPLTYQWQVKGSWIDIPGATSSDFDYTGLLANKDYTVRVIVTDANGNSIVSEPVTFKTSKQVVSGLPESCTLEKGNSISFTTSPKGGTWEYDKEYLSMSDKDGRVTFTAQNAGKTTVNYTVNGTKQAVTVTITDKTASQTKTNTGKTTTSTVPKTGDDSNLYLYFALLGIGMTGIILVFVWNQKRKAPSAKGKG